MSFILCKARPGRMDIICGYWPINVFTQIMGVYVLYMHSHAVDFFGTMVVPPPNMVTLLMLLAFMGEN